MVLTKLLKKGIKQWLKGHYQKSLAALEKEQADSIL